MADKALKSILHMAALAAIGEPGELKDYFDRKVEQGKNKMSVINAVRNKLIHCIFACVRDKRPYSPVWSTRAFISIEKQRYSLVKEIGIWVGSALACVSECGGLDYSFNLEVSCRVFHRAITCNMSPFT